MPHDNSTPLPMTDTMTKVVHPRRARLVHSLSAAALIAGLAAALPATSARSPESACSAQRPWELTMLDCGWDDECSPPATVIGSYRTFRDCLSARARYATQYMLAGSSEASPRWNCSEHKLKPPPVACKPALSKRVSKTPPFAPLPPMPDMEISRDGVIPPPSTGRSVQAEPVNRKHSSTAVLAPDPNGPGANGVPILPPQPVPKPWKLVRERTAFWGWYVSEQRTIGAFHTVRECLDEAANYARLEKVTGETDINWRCLYRTASKK